MTETNPFVEQLQRIKNEELLPPIQTVYVQNLNEKINMVDLKNSLFQLFCTYGQVLEVHAKMNVRARGQAYVVMESTAAAEQAIKTLRGYPFFGKPMRLNYAKKDSDLITKLAGTFDQQVLLKRAQRHTHDLKVRELKQTRKLIDRVIKLRHQTAQLMNQELDPRFGTRHQPSGINKILFIEKVPKRVRIEELNAIFQEFHGFMEVRHYPEKGVAFVEFLTDDLAAQALSQVIQENSLVFRGDDD